MQHIVLPPGIKCSVIKDLLGCLVESYDAGDIQREVVDTKAIEMVCVILEKICSAMQL